MNHAIQSLATLLDGESIHVLITSGHATIDDECNDVANLADYDANYLIEFINSPPPETLCAAAMMVLKQRGDLCPTLIPTLFHYTHSIVLEELFNFLHLKQLPEYLYAVKPEFVHHLIDSAMPVHVRLLAHQTGDIGQSLISQLNLSSSAVKILILKLIHQLFTTPETTHFFYTNDLHVLIDIFIRDLKNDPDMYQFYIRVLAPLLSNTQYPSIKYKMQEIQSCEGEDKHGQRIKEIIANLDEK